jgi:hypothetical protein
MKNSVVLREVMLLSLYIFFLTTSANQTQGALDHEDHLSSPSVSCKKLRNVHRVVLCSMVDSQYIGQALLQ